MHLGEVEEAVVLGAREARRRARQRLEQLVAGPRVALRPLGVLPDLEGKNV